MLRTYRLTLLLAGVAGCLALVAGCGDDAAGASLLECAEACAEGKVCVLGKCVEDTGQTLEAPSKPKCYTPCKGGPDCDEEGLQEGCIGGLECIKGSCTPPEMKDSAKSQTADPIVQPSGEPDAGVSEFGTCAAEGDCPEHQACIAGRCYSDCDADDDCRMDRACVMHVCRLPCTATESHCAADEACVLIDGETGFCKSLAEAGPAIQLPEGTFSVEGDGNPDSSRVLFGSSKQTGTFTIKNDSPETGTFTVTKASHVGITADGQEVSQDDPLAWLAMGAGDDEPTVVDSLTVEVDGDGEAEVRLAEPDMNDFDGWDGTLSVSHPTMGTRTVDLSYKASQEGPWAGHMVFLASGFGEEGLDEWLADKHDDTKTRVLGNAFLQRWTAFRDGKLTLEEFEAMLTATEEGAWQFESVKSRCPSKGSVNPDVACYLSNTPDGISVYSESIADFPVPSGATKLPIAMNLKRDSGAEDFTWAGKIDSNIALHYPGDPYVSIRFATDPNLCGGEGDDCKAAIEEFGVQLAVGGRYATTTSDTSCSAAEGFQQVTVPWLVEGFGGGAGSHHECRDERLPFGDMMDVHALNANLAGSNPIPDGATRKRRLELIDGAMIGSDRLFLIFREVLPSFIDPQSSDEISGYGWIIMKPVTTDLEDKDYEGSVQEDDRTPPTLATAGCAASILDKIGDATGAAAPSLSASTAGEIGVAVVTGVPGALGTALAAADAHWFCTETGKFDTDCPTGRIDYFYDTSGGLTEPTTPTTQTCQASGTCADVFTQWLADDEIYKPSYTCPTSTPDCRTTGPFYDPGAGSPAFHPLNDEIEDAFRYKTQFTSIRGDSSVGFAPVPCDGAVAFCYDADAIEEIEARVDCAVHIYTTYYDDIQGTPEGTTIREYLVGNYGAGTGGVEGFERLRAQLLVMLGDGAYTDTFTTRFDLAGDLDQSFEGSLFEPEGIDLSGPAGFELHSLYKAAQYYQLALDRFYGQARAFRVSMNDLPAGEGFVTQATASGYVDRLLLASTQKARAWQEVAARYQSFHKPDLARTVIERAYAATYLESIILSDLMTDLVSQADPTDKDQIRVLIEQAQHTYTAALLDMGKVHQQISDDNTVFGFAPDYIPFPTLDTLDSAARDIDNAFDKAIKDARVSLDAAAEKEEAALTDARAYAKDEAEFHDNLTSIQLDYEAQLAEICGTFMGDDRAIYPAIPVHAGKSDRTRALGDPCGFVGNGLLHDAIIELEGGRADVALATQKLANIQQSIVDENAKVQAQCTRIQTLATWHVDQANEINSLEDGINSLNYLISLSNKALGMVDKLTELSKCNVGTTTDCPSAAISAGTYVGVAVGINIFQGVSEAIIVGLEARINDVERDIVEHDILEECEAAKIDTQYVVYQLNRDITEAQIELLKSQIQMKLHLSAILAHRNGATSTLAAWEKTRAHAIDVAAAWNDPNVRIYKNDAIVAAETTFDKAVREAYKATKVYEYYTSQSYADLEKLFLVRMVSSGPYPLDQYLTDLETSFNEFDQEFGNPDMRVMVVSLRDDILGIPRLGPDNTAITQDERKELMREALEDPRYRNGEGSLVFPFGTSIDKVSPKTLAHKVYFMEAEILPAMGDGLARVYLAQRGTGVLRNTEGGLNYVSLPERTAVLDVFFEGDRALTPEVYRNERLRERPLINSGWELGIDTKGEDVNGDLELGALDDIRLYIYYTDFTSN